MNDDTIFELPAREVFGPQGTHVVALIERMRRLTLDEARGLASARDAAWGAARDVAWDVAWDDNAWSAAWGAAWDAARGAARDDDALDDALGAAWDAARGAARDNARDAVLALVVRDLITTDHYDTLTRAWRTTIGPIHPDDPELATITREGR